jgi:hypothetical protein
MNDAPDAIWQGFKPGFAGAVDIDEHEDCDAIAKVMEAQDFDAKLDAFLTGLGITDHTRARRVLRWRIGRDLR